jgi:hypothetical protein
MTNPVFFCFHPRRNSTTTATLTAQIHRLVDPGNIRNVGHFFANSVRLEIEKDLEVAQAQPGFSGFTLGLYFAPFPGPTLLDSLTFDFRKQYRVRYATHVWLDAVPEKKIIPQPLLKYRTMDLDW